MIQINADASVGYLLKLGDQFQIEVSSIELSKMKTKTLFTPIKFLFFQKAMGTLLFFTYLKF